MADENEDDVGQNLELTHGNEEEECESAVGDEAYQNPGDSVEMPRTVSVSHVDQAEYHFSQLVARNPRAYCVVSFQDGDSHTDREFEVVWLKWPFCDQGQWVCFWIDCKTEQQRSVLLKLQSKHEERLTDEEIRKYGGALYRITRPPKENEIHLSKSIVIIVYM